MTTYVFMGGEQKQLWSKGSELIVRKKYKKAEKVLVAALDVKDDNPIDRHFIYNQLIELYYKKRDEWKEALGKCIQYCIEDIERLPEFFRYEEQSLRKEWQHSKELNERLGYEKEEFRYYPPRCPSLSQLAIIYEKMGEYEKAIEISNIAASLNQTDGTKGGFEGRISKLQKKIDEGKPRINKFAKEEN